MPTSRRTPLIATAVLLLATCGTAGDGAGPEATIGADTRPGFSAGPTSASSTDTTSADTTSDGASGASGTIGDTGAASITASPGSASTTGGSTTVDANPSSTAEATTSTLGVTTTASAPATVSTTSPTDDGSSDTIVMKVRLDRRVTDAATEGFDTLVRSVLSDDRGWVRAGFRFTFDDPDPDYTIVLAEGGEVDSLCLPYDTFGRFSCQIGPVVALNADRWRTAVDSWPASLDEYRTMLVNHEVGHLTGQHHPKTRCPGDGLPAPVMAQQSSGVAPCTSNPWPLEWEIVCARMGVEPIAPPYERDIQLTCGPDGPIG